MIQVLAANTNPMGSATMLELPWPVSLNHYWHLCQNRIVLSKKAREYRQQVCYIAYPLRRHFWAGRLQVHIEAHPPDKRVRDIDNLLKVTLDSLQAAHVFENDSQIDRIIVERKEVIKDGKIFVSILRLDNV